MIYLKACPKCRGDLTMNRDEYGKFVSCLQCGFMREIGVAAPVAEPSADRRRGRPKKSLAKA